VAILQTNNMRTILLISIIAFSFLNTQAQDPTVAKLKEEATKSVQKKPVDTASQAWKKGGLFNLNFGQASLSNWAAGGDEFSLSVNTLLNLFAFFKKNKFSWDNSLDITYGYINTSSTGGRKNDDRFDLLSKYGYALTSKLNLALLFNARSQFFKGYTYPENIKTFSSDFLSPGYFLLSPGVDYKPATNLSIFLSPVTYRLITVINDTLSAKGLYGVAPGDNTLHELGAFLSVNYMRDFSASLSYKGKLDLFSNYRKNPQNIDLFMTNVFTAKLGKVFSLSWSLDLIYDDDVKLFGPNKTSPALQMKSIAGVGVQAKL
jgi:hypothetical protein